MKHRKVAAATLATLVLGGGSAFGATSHVFGSGGKQYQFDSMCRRVTFVPPGISNHEAINVLGQQVKCIVHRQSATVGVCLDGRPDKNGYQDIKVCKLGDTGYIGSLVAR